MASFLRMIVSPPYLVKIGSGDDELDVGVKLNDPVDGIEGAPPSFTSVWASHDTTINFTDARGVAIVGFPIAAGPNPLSAQSITAITGGHTVWVGYGV